MTRSLLGLLFLGYVALSSSPTRAQDVKYWVFFSDRADAAIGSGAGHVSDRALSRRTLRGGVVDPRTDEDIQESYVHKIEQAGAVPVVRSRWLNAVSATMDPAVRDRVARMPFVREIRPVGVAIPLAERVETNLWPLARPVAPGSDGLSIDYGRSLTQLQIAGMIEPLESGLSGDGVRLGIIDTDWNDLNHPATKHLVDNGQIVAEADFSGQPLETNPFPHARAVLSVAAGFDEGTLIGPAYGADILLARSEYVDTETNQEEDAFVAAMEWMEAQGADVVNVSLGYTAFDTGQNSYTYADLDGDTGITTVVSDLAVQHGVVVVVAAGNEGGCGDPQFCWYYIGTPADGDSVITAGGVRGDGIRYSHSSWGPTFDGRIKPDVSAMAEGVTYAWGTGYSVWNGTSFAAPMVSAAAVLLLETRPDLKPMEIRDILRSTATQSTNPDFSLGWGVINMQAALDLAVGIEDHEQPRAFRVETFPNPFTDRTVLQIDVPRSGSPVEVDIHDLLGRRVWSFRENAPAVGLLEIDVDGINLPSGLLAYRVTSGPTVVTGTLVHLR